MTQENEQPQEEPQTVEKLLFPESDNSDDEKTIDEVHTVAGGNENIDEPGEPSQPAEEQTTEDVIPEEETIQDKLKFIQGSYQEHLRLLKQNDPVMYQQIQAEVKAGRGQITEPVTPDDVYEDDTAKLIKQGFADLKRDQHAQINADKYVQEYQQQAQVLDGFIEKNNVSQEDINMALNKAHNMGFDMETASKNYQIGIPSKAVAYIMETIQNKLMQDYYMGKKVTIEKETIAKTEAVNNATQPTAGATPEPRKLTKDEKLIKVMHDAGGTTKLNDMLGINK